MNDDGARTRPDCRWGLYPILDTQMAGKPHLELAEQLIAGGAKVLQMRDKDAAFEDLLEIGRALREATTRAGVALIVNDNPYLAKEIGADGVHLGQSDFPPYIARELLGPQAIIGISTHNKQQALHALVMPVNYIALGPIYSTTTKVTDNPPLGEEHIRWVRKHTGLPLVAIGGISAERMASVVAAGADNVAVIRELMSAEDIASRTRELLQVVADAKPIS